MFIQTLPQFSEIHLKFIYPCADFTAISTARKWLPAKTECKLCLVSHPAQYPPSSKLQFIFSSKITHLWQLHQCLSSYHASAAEADYTGSTFLPERPKSPHYPECQLNLLNSLLLFNPSSRHTHNHNSP
jgi:hypothetical protein